MNTTKQQPADAERAPRKRKTLGLPSGRDDITLPDWIQLGEAVPRKVTR